VPGFSLHAGVMSSAQDRGKLERLCRYITRSGVSEKRLAITTYPKVRYPLKTPIRLFHMEWRVNTIIRIKFL
jgi:hypothetical protein